ncbi:adenylyl-sulfate kinase [Cycloclasticus pugetii]|uniref:adenylyl-sulfate kinase n=1 Tax=Cycloclasticus pugetii TaxID=34068 RepID=UPI003A922878
MNSAFCVWFYGLSGAGKTTLANALAKVLKDQGIPVVQLDGDDFRKGVSKDLGFTSEDRAENIRRAAELARLLMTQGICVIASFMTPLLVDQKIVKRILHDYKLSMVFINTPIDICMKRDQKSIYKGRFQNVYGVNQKLEFGEQDLNVDGAQPVSQNLTKLLASLAIRNV